MTCNSWSIQPVKVYREKSLIFLFLRKHITYSKKEQFLETLIVILFLFSVNFYKRAEETQTLQKLPVGCFRKPKTLMLLSLHDCPFYVSFEFFRFSFYFSFFLFFLKNKRQKMFSYFSWNCLSDNWLSYNSQWDTIDNFHGI